MGSEPIGHSVLHCADHWPGHRAILIHPDHTCSNLYQPVALANRMLIETTAGTAPHTALGYSVPHHGMMVEAPAADNALGLSGYLRLAELFF